MTKRNIRAIFFDIDGTLVSFRSHALSERTRESLRLLREKGIKLFIATGRHKAFIDNLGDEQFDAYITVNGQLCFNAQEMIHKQSISADSVRSLVELLNRKEYACLFVGEKEYFLNRTNSVTEAMTTLLNFPPLPIDSPERALAMEIYQLVSFVGSEEENEYMQALPHCSPTRWHDLFIDVVPEGGSKQRGMDALLAYYGIDLSETMAFGDGENDISMLRHAGIGVAMGNANLNVQQSADYVTQSVDEDGISRALSHFGLLP